VIVVDLWPGIPWPEVTCPDRRVPDDVRDGLLLHRRRCADRVRRKERARRRHELWVPRTKREGKFSRSSSPEVRSPRTSSRGGSRLSLGIRRESREQGATEAAGARKVPAVCVAVHGSWSWLGDGGAGRCPFPGTIGLSAYDHRPYLRGTIAPIGTSSMGLHGETEAAGRTDDARHRGDGGEQNSRILRDLEEERERTALAGASGGR
jgi:hypothetical protein